MGAPSLTQCENDGDNGSRRVCIDAHVERQANANWASAKLHSVSVGAFLMSHLFGTYMRKEVLERLTPASRRSADVPKAPVISTIIDADAP